jgi:hypothetical protein
VEAEEEEEQEEEEQEEQEEQEEEEEAHVYGCARSKQSDEVTAPPLNPKP